MQALAEGVVTTVEKLANDSIPAGTVIGWEKTSTPNSTRGRTFDMAHDTPVSSPGLPLDTFPPLSTTDRAWGVAGVSHGRG